MIIANCHQKNGFFEHSQSSKISEQYLIFFVLVEHLIISNNMGIKIISTCLHINLNIKCHFTENPSYETHPEAVLIIQMLVSPKIFVPEKRNCTFWKWQNLSFKMAYVTYASDENKRFYRPKRTVGKEKLIRFGL